MALLSAGFLSGCVTFGAVATGGVDVSHGRVYTGETHKLARVDTAEGAGGGGPSWDDYARLQDALLREQENVRQAELQLADSRGVIETLRERVVCLESGYGASRRYTVQKGESLWMIAERELGDPYKWLQIYHANLQKIENPDLLYPGQILLIPQEEQK